jgi:hypothetical protein
MRQNTQNGQNIQNISRRNYTRIAEFDFRRRKLSENLSPLGRWLNMFAAHILKSYSTWEGQKTQKFQRGCYIQCLLVSRQSVLLVRKFGALQWRCQQQQHWVCALNLLEETFVFKQRFPLRFLVYNYLVMTCKKTVVTCCKFVLRYHPNSRIEGVRETKTPKEPHTL